MRDLKGPLWDFTHGAFFLAKSARMRLVLTKGQGLRKPSGQGIFTEICTKFLAEALRARD